eukprot:TRINITY_DN40638_c0_g1_i1.p1 TRINITY_DN40638_c0_g1~~TRINITY_DN40638_c0_g1_i1.p1  ORF type:complete len:431 (+),score=79.75 TRINITY_DN40638_c0_g1_i1:76-1293(+)
MSASSAPLQVGSNGEPLSPSAAAEDHTERVLLVLSGGDSWDLLGNPSRNVPKSASELYRRMIEIDSMGSPTCGPSGLSRRHLVDCLMRVEIRERLRRSPLRMLLYRRNFERVWRQMAPKGVVTEDEFVRFAESAGNQRRHFLTMRALVKWRAYWGLGQYGHHVDPFGVVSRGLVPVGLLDDYVFYVRNNHPLLSIFTADPAHPFDRQERLLTELVTLGFSFLMSGLSGMWAPAGLIGWVWSGSWVAGLVYVTVPCYLLWYLLWLVQACPCLLIDPHTATRRWIACARRLEFTGSLVATIMLGLGLAFWGLGVWLYLVNYAPGMPGGRGLQPAEDPWRRALLWVLARVDAYLVIFVYYLVVHFSPVWSLHTVKPDGALRGFLRLAGVGQWRTEKEHFHHLEGVQWL